MLPDNIWRCVLFFRNYNTSVLVFGPCSVRYSLVLVLEISGRA